MAALQDRTLGMPAQKRQMEVRRRVLKGARIAFNDHATTMDCVVRNLSEGGACLNVESPIGIPDSFDLLLDDPTVRHCRVTWRKATQIGVAFA